MSGREVEDGEHRDRYQIGYEEYSEELCGILTKIEEAKDMLAQLTDEMDDKDQSTEDVDEAMDALDDAIDILEDLM